MNRARSSGDRRTATSDVSVVVAPGVRLHAAVRRAGRGTPFLFVPGLASNARLWDGVAGLVAGAGHSSVAVDLRGHGRSSQVDTGYDFATLARDLEAVIDATVDRPVIAVGQSWGGNVVLELAARHPRRVAGLGLVDGGFIRLAETFPDWDEARTVLTPPPFDDLTEAQLEGMLRRQLTGFSDAAIAAQLANFEGAQNGTVRPRLRRHNHMTILRRLWEHDPDEIARGLGIPIRVIAVHGGSPSRPERVAVFADAARAATVHWVDGHHDVHAQQPEVVAEVLIALAHEVES